MIMRCVGLHTMDVEPTGYVRYVRTTDGAEKITGPYCDEHQADMCVALRWRERAGEIRKLGAVPLDYAERIAEARRAGAVRRIADEIKGTDGTQDEIADMIIAALDALPMDYRHTAIKSVVLGKLQRWADEQDEARATMLAEIDPEEVF